MRGSQQAAAPQGACRRCVLPPDLERAPSVLRTTHAWRDRHCGSYCRLTASPSVRVSTSGVVQGKWLSAAPCAKNASEATPGGRSSENGPVVAASRIIGATCSMHPRPNSGSGTATGWVPSTSSRSGTDAPQPSNWFTCTMSLQFTVSSVVVSVLGMETIAQNPVEPKLQLGPIDWVVTDWNRHCAGSDAVVMPATIDRIL